MDRNHLILFVAKSNNKKYSCFEFEQETWER